MAEQDKKKEIRRIRTLLAKMAEMAEHVEQTGSFQSSIQNNVKRYNNIVEHLEDQDILPEDVFPELDEDSDSGQLGAEAKLLADYLSDLADEEEPMRGPEGARKAEGKRPDLGMMVALAPFLERSELTNIVLKHFTGRTTPSEEETPAAPGNADIQTVIALAPHVDKATLGQMARACLAKQPLTDPKMLVALAPHMDSAEFSALLRAYLPDWFGAAPVPPTAPTPPAPPTPPVAPTPPTPPSFGPEMQRMGSEERELR